MIETIKNKAVPEMSCAGSLADKIPLCVIDVRHETSSHYLIFDWTDHIGSASSSTKRGIHFRFSNDLTRVRRKTFAPACLRLCRCLLAARFEFCGMHCLSPPVPNVSVTFSIRSTVFTSIIINKVLSRGGQTTAISARHLRSKLVHAIALEMFQHDGTNPSEFTSAASTPPGDHPSSYSWQLSHSWH